MFIHVKIVQQCLLEKKIGKLYTEGGFVLPGCSFLIFSACFLVSIHGNDMGIKQYPLRRKDPDGKRE